VSAEGLGAHQVSEPDVRRNESRLLRSAGLHRNRPRTSIGLGLGEADGRNRRITLEHVERTTHWRDTEDHRIVVEQEDERHGRFANDTVAADDVSGSRVIADNLDGQRGPHGAQGLGGRRLRAVIEHDHLGLETREQLQRLDQSRQGARTVARGDTDRQRSHRPAASAWR
jgi:hypothetical protein